MEVWVFSFELCRPHDWTWPRVSGYSFSTARKKYRSSLVREACWKSSWGIFRVQGLIHITTIWTAIDWIVSSRFYWYHVPSLVYMAITVFLVQNMKQLWRELDGYLVHRLPKLRQVNLGFQFHGVGGHERWMEFNAEDQPLQLNERGLHCSFWVRDTWRLSVPNWSSTIIVLFSTAAPVNQFRRFTDSIELLSDTVYLWHVRNSISHGGLLIDRLHVMHIHVIRSEHKNYCAWTQFWIFTNSLRVHSPESWKSGRLVPLSKPMRPRVLNVFMIGPCPNKLWMLWMPRSTIYAVKCQRPSQNRYS